MTAEQEAYQRGFADGWAKALETMGRAALPGVKSRDAWRVEEERIDRAIAAGTQTPFAIVICGANDLKGTNDTHGHAAGDELLKSVCSQVCRTFKHSPVYRIGGDEFAAILQGEDYDNRHPLMSQLNDPRLASGIADWNQSSDQHVTDVLKRADAAMYENKHQHRASH